MKYDIAYTSRQVRCKLQGVCCYIVSKHELWSTNGFKLDRSFYPPSVYSAFHGSPLLKKWDQKTFTFVRFFYDFET